MPSSSSFVAFHHFKQLIIVYSLSKWMCACSHMNKGVCHIVALPFVLQSILRQTNNYGNSFIMQKYNLLKKPSKRNQSPSRHHNSITTLKFQTQASQNIILQKSSYKNRPST